MSLTGSPPAVFDFTSLSSLSSSIKPQSIDSILVDSFRSKNSPLDQSKVEKWQSLLGATIDIQQLHISLSSLIRLCLFHSIDGADAVQSLFPQNFDPTIAAFISTLIAARLPDWRETTISSLPGPPKLLSFDWKVNERMSSPQLARLNAPTINVTMALQSSSNTAIERVSFELSRPALATMLTGLERISEQLESMH